LSEFDSALSADRMLDRLMTAAQSLEQQPERGRHPKALLARGIKTYCQVVFKPSRLICRQEGTQVFVMLIVDGRRDLQCVREERLLGGA